MKAKKICPISDTPMQPLFRHKLLSKYEVEYFHCSHCGLIQTEEPYWLNEAYEHAISSLDTGILHRNIRIRRYLEPLIELLGLSQGRFADIGGGYGTLTRLMRDIGYNFNTHDPYCENIFAKNFEVQSQATYDALLAFEVIEHLNDPTEFIKASFSKYSTKTIFLSTNTYKRIPEKTWWYYSFDSGQHISFYQKKTLSILAKKNGCRLYSLNDSVHVITDKKVNFLKFLLMRNKFAFLVYAMITRARRFRKTRMFEDQEYIKTTPPQAPKNNGDDQM
jgi:hypothetical protein